MTRWTPRWWPPRLCSGPFSGGKKKRQPKIYPTILFIICHYFDLYFDLPQYCCHNEIRTAVAFDLEEALNVFSWSIVLHSGVCVLPHHVIDGPHDVHHLLECDGQNGGNVIENVRFFGGGFISFLTLLHSIITSQSKKKMPLTYWIRVLHFKIKLDAGSDQYPGSQNPHKINS